MDVMFDVSFEAKELHRHVKRVEDCKRLATEGNRNALSREGPQNEKLR